MLLSKLNKFDVSLTSSDTIQWALWSNVSSSSLTGASFSAPPGSGSVLIDQSATALNTTGCFQVASGIVTTGTKSATGTALDLFSYFSQIGRDSFARTSEVFTLALIHPPGISAGTVTGTVLLSWQELL
jgi:hypothetical protein